MRSVITVLLFPGVVLSAIYQQNNERVLHGKLVKKMKVNSKLACAQKCARSQLHMSFDGSMCYCIEYKEEEEEGVTTMMTDVFLFQGKLNELKLTQKRENEVLQPTVAIAWSSWSKCIQTCSKGTTGGRSRQKACGVNEQPQGGRTYCHGQMEPCVAHSACVPSCEDFRSDCDSYSTTYSCNTTRMVVNCERYCGYCGAGVCKDGETQQYCCNNNVFCDEFQVVAVCRKTCGKCIAGDI